MISLKKILQEAFGDYYKKNTWMQLPRHVVADNADQLFDLIRMAYADKGGHLKIKSRNDVMDRSEIDYWVAIDTDDDPDPDAAIGGMKTPIGYKLSVMGQDGGKDAKRSVIQHMIKLMQTRGFYAELDMDLANKFGLQIMTDQDTISKVLAGKELEFLDNGVYRRKIGNKIKEKVLVGKL